MHTFVPITGVTEIFERLGHLLEQVIRANATASTTTNATQNCMVPAGGDGSRSHIRSARSCMSHAFLEKLKGPVSLRQALPRLSYVYWSFGKYSQKAR